MLLPAVLPVMAVTVTTLVLDVALTPTLLPFPARLMALARWVASVVVLFEIEKFVPVSSPAVPLFIAPLFAQVKPLAIVVESVMALFPRAGSMACTVTTPELEVAVTGTLAVLVRAMAAARFEATIAVVAGAVLVQNEKLVPVFTPSLPPVRPVAVQAKPLLLAESENVAP